MSKVKRQTHGVMVSSAMGRSTVIQHSVLTGFRHHAASRFWPALTLDATLTLLRESENAHDSDAVAVHWKGYKLGYLPRGENFMVARLLDRQCRLSARIRRLEANAHRNRRVCLDVLLH